MKTPKHTNQLIRETSPYLLQHAHNPVDWHPWNEETLSKALKEDKMILVSIGYSACHWCHVMEHESFEDEAVASVMNEHFICIKVDREERPDVDQVYMEAVQMISGRGGWPLNCFAMPDGKPVWGGTYFRKGQWMEILENIAMLYATEREKLEAQSEELFAGIQKDRFIDPSPAESMVIDKEVTASMARSLLGRIDQEEGGFRGAPKFPMPNNLLFLLRYHFHLSDPEALEGVDLTLRKMAEGGIHDQVGGGFARYSVDDRWHVPHFEKMLYDNAQLVSLYSEAFRLTRHPLYEAVIRDTLAFCGRELSSPEGGFYSALDADSEGVEGKFYVWKQEEFNDLLGSDAPLLSEYFGMGGDAYWEEGNHVLIRARKVSEMARDHGLMENEVENVIERGREKLFMAREIRVRPGLDDKILVSWNALMLKGYIDAYRALNEPAYLNIAIKNALFILKNMLNADGSLQRTFSKGGAVIGGFLDDYAFLMEAFTGLYEVTFDEKWLTRSEQLANYTIDHFRDKETGLFWYTSDRHRDTVARKVDVTDNVIPASLSSLARAFQILGLLLEKQVFTDIAEGLLAKVKDPMKRFPSAFTNWGILYLQKAFPVHTVVITGPDAGSFREAMKTPYRPDIVLAGGNAPSSLPILKNRLDPKNTRIFVCTGSECKMPVESVKEAFELLGG